MRQPAYFVIADGNTEASARWIIAARRNNPPFGQSLPSGS
jgi:hypothetical protein